MLRQYRGCRYPKPDLSQIFRRSAIIFSLLSAPSTSTISR